MLAFLFKFPTFTFESQKLYNMNIVFFLTKKCKYTLLQTIISRVRSEEYDQPYYNLSRATKSFYLRLFNYKSIV